MSERGRVGFGGTVIEYTIVRSRRRKKTVAITLDPDRGVVIAAPVSTSPDRVRELVEKRAGWILRRGSSEILESRRKAFVSGESLPYLGREARLFVEHADVRWPRLLFDHWNFYVTAPARLEGEERRAAIERALTTWYRRRAAERLTERTARWAELAGRAPTAIYIRDQRRRWASCSADGTLRFNWRIIMAPPPLMDYVVVHELAHLRVRNHSADFWAVVARLLPDYELRRSQLKALGPSLAI